MKRLIIIAIVCVATSAYGQIVHRLDVLYYNEGKKLYYQCDLSGAAKKWEHALKIAKENRNKKGVSDLLTNLGVVYKNLGKYRKAISYYKQGLKIKKKIGEKNGIGVILTNLGNAYMNICNYQKAISFYESALEIHKEIGDKKKIGENLMTLWIVHYYHGDYQRAIFYYKQAFKINQEIFVPTEYIGVKLADDWINKIELVMT